MTELSEAPPSAATNLENKDERLEKLSFLTRMLKKPSLGSVVGAVVVFVLFAVVDSTSNHLWLTQTGVSSWSTTAAFFGIMSVPVGLLMIGGEFDLSTGVMTGVTAILMAVLMNNLHWNAWLAVLGTVIFAGIMGAINGYVVVRTKLPSFIVTLATFFILRGLSIGGLLLINSGSTQISLVGNHYGGLRSLQILFGSSFFSSSSLPNGYSTAILWFIAVTIIGVWILGRTRFGNWVYAVGGDMNAARNIGVPVRRTKISLFMGTSISAALVGIITFAQSSSAVSEQGVGYEFYYIIAAVVGGCLLTGGYGSVFGAALGACIIGMAFEGVIYAGWDSSWDFTFLGIILFLAVAVNMYVFARAQKARH